MPVRICILTLLITLIGCSDRPGKPSEPVRKMQTCRRFVEDSTAVVLTLKKGMNDFELESLEKDRRLGLHACLKKHPDLPGRCLDLSSRESVEKSMELAVTLCVSWPDRLVECLSRQDLDSPACQSALEAFRGRD
jgi:hypothetical protein